MPTDPNVLYEENKPLITKSFVSPINQKKITKCILLFGPRMVSYTLKTKKCLEEQGLEVKQIGNGLNNIGDNDYIELYKYLMSSYRNKERYLLFIVAHGAVIDNEHYFNLGDAYARATKSLFKRIALFLQNQPIDVFTDCCYGGAASAQAWPFLPKGSTFAATSSSIQTTYANYFNQLIDSLFLTKLENVTAENLLLRYLISSINIADSPINALMTRSAQFHIFSEEELKKRIGRKFSLLEKRTIFLKLEKMAKKEIIVAAIELIEKDVFDSPTNITYIRNQKEYGVILAICHTLLLDVTDPTSREINPNIYVKNNQFTLFLKNKIKINHPPRFCVKDTDQIQEMKEHIQINLTEIRKTNRMIKLLDQFVKDKSELKKIYINKKQMLGHQAYSQEGVQQLFTVLENATHHHKRTGFLKVLTLSYNSIRHPGSYKELQSLRTAFKCQFDFDLKSDKDQRRGQDDIKRQEQGRLSLKT